MNDTATTTPARNTTIITTTPGNIPMNRGTGAMPARMPADKSFSQSMFFGIPTKTETQTFTQEEHGEESWRTRLLHILHSTTTEIILMILLLCDVLILFVEIFLMASFPPCSIIERDAIACCPLQLDDVASSSSSTAVYHDDEQHLRLLAGSSGEPLCASGLDYDLPSAMASCDVHKWSGVHEAEKYLFAGTVTILVFFFIELSLSIVVLTPAVFFRQFFFLFDFIVVTVSLALELTLHYLHEDRLQALIGLLIVGRVWRFVRIGHGIVEVTHKFAQQHEKHHPHHYDDAYVRSLEETLRVNGLELPERTKPEQQHA